MLILALTIFGDGETTLVADIGLWICAVATFAALFLQICRRKADGRWRRRWGGS